MEAIQRTVYSKHGCYFTGNLVSVDYMASACQDRKWGQFGAEVTMDYLDYAKELVKRQFGEPVRVCLAIPEYVVEVQNATD